MNQVLTLELSDEVYTALKQESEVAGVSISQWIAISLEQRCGLLKKKRTKAEKAAARQRFRHHAGAIDLGYATRADNESIDADLVRAYSHELGEVS